jgi:1-acyl-sn-glycerol-3-phosphate acyltransferase
MEGSARKIRFIKTKDLFYKIIYFSLAPIGIFICKYVMGIKVVGRQIIKDAKHKHVVLISNHCMYQDPLVILYATFPNKVLFTTTQRNVDLPLIGRFIKIMGAIALPQKKYPRDISKYLNNNKLIHFFPEGHMFRFNREIKKFHKGAFYLAYKYQLPVICICNKVEYRRIGDYKIKWLPKKITSTITNAQMPPIMDDLAYSKTVLDNWASDIRAMMQGHL